MASATLFIVATPIGNMGDMSFRAVEVLKKCSLVLSEDTRETNKLFSKFDISTKQISYRDQNHTRVLPFIEQSLDSGNDVALVSDSGTPLISDPGYKLIHELTKKGYNVQCIPGPSALISSLVVSGFPTDKFSFLGFLPKGSSARKTLLASYGALDSTVIVYESPYRVLKLLEEINEALGNRYVCVVSELTKVYEKVYRGDVRELIPTLKKEHLRGEFVVLVAKEGFIF